MRTQVTSPRGTFKAVSILLLAFSRDWTPLKKKIPQASLSRFTRLRDKARVTKSLWIWSNNPNFYVCHLLARPHPSILAANPRKGTQERREENKTGKTGQRTD